MFRALVVEKDAEGKTHAAVQELGDDRLPAGDVTVAVEYSTVNYKDGLCLGSGRRPRAGLAACAGDRLRRDRGGVGGRRATSPGDKVVLTGWRVGEAHWGGYATRARVKADWLVPLPAGLDTRAAMAVGTAGLTAMLAVIALERHGLKPGQGPVLVTGAAGGVGSVAVAVLAALGHEVAAVTGRPEQGEYLRGLGAARDRGPGGVRGGHEEAPGVASAGRGAWMRSAGVMLGRVLKQMKYGTSVAAIGLAGGAAIEGALITPFILRGVNLLGIDSVMRPYADRVEAWGRIAKDLPMEKLDAMVETAGLGDLPEIGRAILEGRVRGRVVVDVRA